ncbi:hypothetical protein CDV36_016596, partial [Fusarium kuroshium]
MLDQMDEICRRVRLVTNRKFMRVSADHPTFEERDDDVGVGREASDDNEHARPYCIQKVPIGLVKGDVLELLWEQLEWSLDDGITPLGHG